MKPTRLFDDFGLLTPDGIEVEQKMTEMLKQVDAWAEENFKSVNMKDAESLLCDKIESMCVVARLKARIENNKERK